MIAFSPRPAKYRGQLSAVRGQPRADRGRL